MNHVLIYATLFLCCSGLAMILGGAPERVATVLFVAGNVLSIIVQRPFGSAWVTIETAVFVVDILLFVALIGLALVADRYWTIWLASLQGITVLMHLAAAGSPAFIAPAYYSAVAASGYPMAVLLAIGAWRHHRRLTIFGSDGAWRSRQ